MSLSCFETLLWPRDLRAEAKLLTTTFKISFPDMFLCLTDL